MKREIQGPHHWWWKELRNCNNRSGVCWAPYLRCVTVNDEWPQGTALPLSHPKFFSSHFPTQSTPWLHSYSTIPSSIPSSPRLRVPIIHTQVSCVTFCYALPLNQPSSSTLRCVDPQSILMAGIIFWVHQTPSTHPWLLSFFTF